MNNTMELLREMKLNGFLRGIEEQRTSTLYSDLSFDERIAHLVDKEYNLRCNKKIQRNLQRAKLKHNASVEDLDFQTKRGLKKVQIAELSQCHWVKSGTNLLVVGPTGVGKTFVACALANSACRRGYSARYEKTANVILSLAQSRADGSYSKQQRALSSVQVLILDEWLRDGLTPLQAREILDMLDDRHQRTATIFVSQLPIDKWHQLIDDPTIADAILDRVVHNAQRVELNGESMRKLLSKSGKDSTVSVEGG